MKTTKEKLKLIIENFLNEEDKDLKNTSAEVTIKNTEAILKLNDDNSIEVKFKTSKGEDSEVVSEDLQKKNGFLNVFLMYADGENINIILNMYKSLGMIQEDEDINVIEKEMFSLKPIQRSKYINNKFFKNKRSSLVKAQEIIDKIN
jgi:hypothetical protein